MPKRGGEEPASVVMIDEVFSNLSSAERLVLEALTERGPSTGYELGKYLKERKDLREAYPRAGVSQSVIYPALNSLRGFRLIELIAEKPLPSGLTRKVYWVTWLGFYWYLSEGMKNNPTAALKNLKMIFPKLGAAIERMIEHKPQLVDLIVETLEEAFSRVVEDEEIFYYIREEEELPLYMSEAEFSKVSETCLSEEFVSVFLRDNIGWDKFYDDEEVDLTEALESFVELAKGTPLDEYVAKEASELIETLEGRLKILREIAGETRMD